MVSPRFAEEESVIATKEDAKKEMNLAKYHDQARWELGEVNFAAGDFGIGATAPAEHFLQSATKIQPCL